MADYTIPQGTVPWDAQMNANLTDINTRLTTGETTNAAQATAISTLQTSDSTQTANITALQASDATQNTNISTNTGNITTLQGQMSTANTNIATNTANIATNTSNIATNTTNITTLQGQMTTVTNTANQAVPRDTLVISVKDHGAAGDGTTDDTSAINAAVTSLGGNGGTVYFPPGTYRLNNSNPITLPANTSLVGASPEASTILIGSSNTAGAAVNVTGDYAQVSNLTIRGTSSTVSSNPTAFGVQSVNNQFLKIENVIFRFVNNYAVKAWGDTVDTGTGGTTLHGGVILNSSIVSCAGGVYLKTTNGGSISSVWPANFQIIGLFTRFLGLNAGSSPNLDGIRIEDCGDVLVQNCFAWMNASTGGTGSAFHVNGNCAAIFVQNLDALGPTTGAANVLLDSNANGDPQNVQINGGVIQQGAIGLSIGGAVNQVRVRGVRILNNQTHNVQVSSTGFGIYLDECLLSLGGQGATGTNYDINWTGSAEGWITDCRFGSSIVSSGTAGVQGVIQNTSATIRVVNVNFTGTGTTAANKYTGVNPQFHMDGSGTNLEWRGNMDMRLTGSNRLQVAADTSASNAIAFNVGGTAGFDNARILGDGTMQFGTGSGSRDTTWGRQGTANIGTTDSDISINLAGKSLKVKSGTNAKAGTVTANGTTAVTVSTTAITANSVVVFGLKTQSGTAATTAPFMSAVTAGTSFQIKSSAGDTSVYNWVILDLI